MKWHLSSGKSTTLIALITKRTTAGSNAWRKVEGVMGDIRISRKLKGNVFRSCVTRLYMNALEMMAPTEKQQSKVQLREEKPSRNNCGR